MKKNILKILDIILVLVLVSLIVLKLYPYAEKIMYRNAKVNAEKLSTDYDMVANIEYLIGQYYNYIQLGKLDEVNEICAFTCKKSDKDLEKIKNKIGMFESPRAKVFELTEVGANVYAAKFIMKEKTEKEDNQNYYNINIKLMPEETLFNVINDNWNIE